MYGIIHIWIVKILKKNRMREVCRYEIIQIWIVVVDESEKIMITAVNFPIEASHTFSARSVFTSLPMRGFIAQLVEHRTGIRGGHGFESHWSPDFFQASPFQLPKLENLLQRSFFSHFQEPKVLFWFLTNWFLNEPWTLKLTTLLLQYLRVP